MVNFSKNVLIHNSEIYNEATIRFAVQPEDARVLETQGTPKAISSVLSSLLLQKLTVWNSSVHKNLQTPVNQSTDHQLIVKIP